MMKKINLIFIALLFVSVAGFAQITGGGGAGNGAEKEAPAEKGPWKHRFNINFGFNKPMGMWHQMPAMNATLADAYLQNTGFGVRNGFSFELGSTFFLKKLPELMDDKLKFAINVNYMDFSFMPIAKSWQSLGGVYSSASYTPFFFIGLKLGALASYNIAEKMYADLYFNYNPVFSIAGSIDGTTPDLEEFHSTGLGFGSRFTTGVNFRILVFNIGAELVLGNVKYVTDVNIEDKVNGSPVDDVIYSKFNTNTLRLKAGFSF
jgi:hypothetical protein